MTQRRAIRFQNLFCLGLGALVSLALLQPATAAAATAKSKVAVSKKAVASKSTSRKAVAKSSVAKRAVKSPARSTSLAKRSAKKPVLKSTVARQSRKGKSIQTAKSANGKRSATRSTLVAKTRVSNDPLIRVATQPRLSVGERLGLRSSDDPLDLNSSVALVVDQETNEILLSKNDSAILPIASITKLMTGLVLAEANLPMDEPITITQEDVDTYKGSRSRLAVGSTLSRGEMMHLALMSSENRAAHALGRTYPGGLKQFVRLMNAKAFELGMTDTRYVEPTGLSSLNQSSARDLATLVSAAYERPILRSLSTSPGHQLEVGHRTLQYNNTNRLIRNPEWDIGLQKTGYISEAGRCLVMQTRVAGRKLIMVFLDSTGRASRSNDAERVRHWVETQNAGLVPQRPQG